MSTFEVGVGPVGFRSQGVSNVGFDVPMRFSFRWDVDIPTLV